MHGQEAADLGRRQGGDGALHGVADVVQFPVGEDAEAGLRQRPGHLHAAGGQQLQSDLVEADAVAQPLHQGLGFGDGRDIQGHDQARVGGHRQASGVVRLRSQD